MSASPAWRRDHPGPGPGGEVRVAVELGARRGVEGVGVGHEQLRLGGVLADVEQVLDEHPERRTPVADVVLPDHVVAEVLQRAGERVADDGGAQVADVHLLGHVGRGVVDRDVSRSWAGTPSRSSRRSTWSAIQASAKPDVDEPRPADLRRSGDAVEVEVLDDLLRDLPRRLADLLGQRQRRVDLEVGELGGPDHRVGVGVLGPERRPEGALEPLGQHVPRTGHARQAIGRRG